MSAIDSGEVLIPAADRDLPAFRAMPTGGRSLPVIVVVHEIFGIYGHLDAVCRQWAEDGYFVIAPMLYVRQGDVHREKDFERIKDISMRVPDAQVRDDLDHVFRWIGTQAEADQTRIGLTGFCWGGRQVWLYAAHNPAVRAGVAWYGGPLSAAPTALRPRNPLDVAGELKAPVLGLYGGSDALIPLASIQQMQQRLAALQSPSRICVYPASRHGFHAPSRQNYDAEASRDGDRRLMEWFIRYGVV